MEIIERSSMIWPIILLWIRQNTDGEDLFPSILEVMEHTRPAGYCEMWLPNYLNYDFFQLFRMSRKAFQKLNEKIRVIHVLYIGGGIPIPAEKRLIMLLWWLGKAVDKSNTLLLDEIIGLQHNYITWPNHNEIETVTNEFYRRGVVGAIDVANINFKSPTEQQESYIDRKMQHSIKLQGICTSDKIFTNIVVGWPGSVHDSRVFQNCEIFRKVSNTIDRNKYFPTLEHHLVGDSAYPLLDYMMTPYR